MRVEICGGIASGKTTLATLLADQGAYAALEKFQDNPFFTKFYADPQKYAFETEITYLLQHFSQLQELDAVRLVASDFSFALDLAYAFVTLPISDLKIFDVVLRRVVEKIGPPSLIVRLDCESRVEVQRIRQRGREVEQRISREYLDALDAAIDRSLGSGWFRGVPVIRIDSALADFRPDGDARQRVCEEINFALATRLV